MMWCAQLLTLVRPWRQALLGLFGLLAALSLTACGSGPSDGNSGGVTPGKTSLVLSLTSAGGQSISQLGVGETATLSARLYDANSKPVPQTVLTFSAGSSTASLFPAAGTALTDSSGTASVQITGVAAGADLASVSVTLDGTTTTASLGYSITGSSTSTPALALSMTLANGTATTSLALGQTAIVKATLLDGQQQPLANQVITFSNDPAVASMTPSTGKALTDAQGVATLQLTGLVISADTLAASVSLNGSTLSQTLSYSVSTPSFDLANLQLGLNPLSPGGSTGISVEIVDPANANTAYPSPVSVSFSSPCASAGRAQLDSSVSSVLANGKNTATATYVDKGCASTDTITARLAIGDKLVERQVVLTVQTAAAASIQFVSVLPTSISLKGIGGVEQATVSFKVTDALGNGLPNVQVNFAPDTTVGGIVLSTASALTQSDGTASTLVQAGSVSTSVRVTASLNSDASIRSQSSQLLISTGLPHQNGLSIRIDPPNPEAWSADSVTATVTAKASDRFGNPVPDGTAISFWLENGIGLIEPGCQTVQGSCSVTFTSGGNRQALVADAQGHTGRSTLLATAIGEESFLDLNGDGWFNSGDVLLTDLPEAYVDANESGVLQNQTATGRDSTEAFIDFNRNGSFDGADGLFNGKGCTSGCGSNTAVTVRSQAILVWADGSNAPQITGLPASVDLGGASRCDLNTVEIPLQFADANGNALPKDTSISIDTTDGTLLSASSLQIPNSINPFGYRLILQNDRPDDGTGTGACLADSTLAGLVSFTFRPPSGREHVITLAVTH